MFNKIGLIGTGTMGSIVITALNKAMPEIEVLLSNRTKAKAEALASELYNATVTSSAVIAAECDVIFLGVKPHNLTDIESEIGEILRSRLDRVVVVSMLANFSAKGIQTALDITSPVIAMMPNTPVAVGEGIILYDSEGLTSDEENEFENAFYNAGHIEKCDEELMQMAGTLTGCGPALVYMLIGSLADSAVAGGLPRDKAIKLACQMVKGAAAMVAKSGKEPEALKNEVCSPKGTTIRMVRRLEEKNFRSAVFEGLAAAHEGKVWH